MAPRWTDSSGKHGISRASVGWAIAHASYITDLADNGDGAVDRLFIGPEHAQTDRELEMIVHLWTDHSGRDAIIFHAIQLAPKFDECERNSLMDSERDNDARSDRYADPDTPITPVGDTLTGAEAAAADRNFLVAEYGSEDAVHQLIRRGRPRVGEKRAGGSAIVRARISDQDFAAFKRLEDQTGKSQAELVREGVRLLLAQHQRAS